MTFVNAFRMAYTAFLNREIKEIPIAQIIATSTDKLLKKGQNEKSIMEVEQFIQNTASIFSHLEDKDIFIEVYRNQLARRLLNDKLVLEFEKQFIGKIKMLCGPVYTSKLEGMI